MGGFKVLDSLSTKFYVTNIVFLTLSKFSMGSFVIKVSDILAKTLCKSRKLLSALETKGDML